MTVLMTEPPQAATQDSMAQCAKEVASVLKALAHESRLLILCYLAQHGELSVGQLEKLLDKRQAAVSQLLSRLREDSLVTTRREGKTVYYTMREGPVREILGLLHRIYCPEDA